MFRIRREQMEELGRRSRAKFVAMMADYLRETFPLHADTLGASQVEPWVDAAVAKAERYGITTEPECAQTVLLLLPLGLDADERLDWVKETLTDRDLVAIGKVRKLAREAREKGVEGVDDVLVYDFVEA